MSAPKWLANFDLAFNQLLNGRFQNLASAPSSPSEGWFYYDTTLHQFGVWNGTAWTYLGASVSNAITRAVVAGAANELIVAGGADRSAQSYTTNGLLKIAAGVVATAAAGTDYVTGASTNTFTNKTFDAAGTGNSLLNIALSMFATNVADTDGTLAANSDTRLATQKAIVTYVQSFLQGLKWKAPVRAATTVNGTLATAYANGSVIDGVTLATNDRILLKNQTTGADNGIYTVNASGAPTRAVDADTGTEVLGMVVDVLEGSANVDTAWVNTNSGVIILGTTALTFVDYIKTNVPSATTSIQGKVQLAQTSDTAARSSTTLAVTPASLAATPQKFTATIGDGSTTAIAVTHNLGTKDIIWSIRDASTDSFVFCDVVATSTTVATFTFNVAPASNAYKVVIQG